MEDTSTKISGHYLYCLDVRQNVIAEKRGANINMVLERVPEKKSSLARELQ